MARNFDRRFTKFFGDLGGFALPVPSPLSTLGRFATPAGVAVWLLLNPTPLGDGTLDSHQWDLNGNGIPDLIEPLDEDDC